MASDVDRAARIKTSYDDPVGRPTAEMLTDLEEDVASRGIVISELRLMDREDDRYPRRRTRSRGFLPEGIVEPRLDTDVSFMDRSLVGGEAQPREIVVMLVKRHWFVRADGEDIAVAGGKSEAIDRACSIAQLGDGLRDVVIFQRDGSVEERRSFGR